MPEIADRPKFGSESDTFVATSSDIQALKQLDAALHTVFHSRRRHQSRTTLRPVPRQS